MLNVIIVDNEATFRKGLKTVLMNICDVNIIAEASNGEEFLSILKESKVDLVFMDIKMPIMDGIEATKKATTLFPNIAIYGFSSYETQEYINKMLDAGARGYLSKSKDNYDILSNIINNQSSANNAETNKTTN